MKVEVCHFVTERTANTLGEEINDWIESAVDEGKQIIDVDIKYNSSLVAQPLGDFNPKRETVAKYSALVILKYE